ncbi:hypothetical protein AVEN_212452-1 [Araneus ventricosus]|uniref:Uncharacterized protein n=1 Tax=Araneus ventricosus TaxID=182803 RepID=A0A4Y2MWA2_ARAVE|nr:hypothetical protein AVEN_212452-1 [Araneus ventricosus]
MAALHLLQQRSSHNSKSMTHFIAQTIGAAICAYASSTWKCNYRFLDIQIISNKLRVAPVVHNIHLRTVGMPFVLWLRCSTRDPKVPGSKLRTATRLLMKLHSSDYLESSNVSSCKQQSLFFA